MTRIAVGDTSPAGLREPSYVNGRLLTAADLTAGRDAVLVRDRWLGLAIGAGVATGLEVNGPPGSSVLHVSPGTGVSSGGTAVHLDAPASLDLAVVTASAPVTGERFADCAPGSTPASAPTAGAYLLVARSASSVEGKVPVAGAPTATLPTPCTSRWVVEDLAFAAIRLDGFATATTAANRRNLLAHFCFGSARHRELALSGFAEPVPWRGIEGLAELTPCDLPLAVFDWDGAALTFVDGWSARRRPARPAATVALAAVVGDDRAAEGEARFLQFQDQLSGLLASPGGRAARALDRFPLLPPAGLVPFDPLPAAERLLDLGADFTPAKEPEDPARRARSLKQLAVRARDAEAGYGRLGAVSQLLVELRQEVDALRAEVDGLAAALGGRGGPGSSASARARGRRLAAVLAGGLVDTPGDGVDLAAFFGGVRVRLGVVDRETVDFTIRRSWFDEAIDLGTGPVVNVLFVVAGDGDEDGEDVAPYVLFTRRHRGARWIEPAARELAP